MPSVPIYPHIIPCYTIFYHVVPCCSHPTPLWTPTSISYSYIRAHQSISQSYPHHISIIILIDWASPNARKTIPKLLCLFCFFLIGGKVSIPKNGRFMTLAFHVVIILYRIDFPTKTCIYRCFPHIFPIISPSKTEKKNKKAHSGYQPLLTIEI